MSRARGDGGTLRVAFGMVADTIELGTCELGTVAPDCLDNATGLYLDADGYDTAACSNCAPGMVASDVVLALTRHIQDCLNARYAPFHAATMSALEREIFG